MWRFLGLQSKNRPEWLLFHLANMHISATTVALYDTLGQDALAYIMELTELRTIGIEGSLVDKLLNLKKKETERLSYLTAIINFDNTTSQENLDLANELGVQIFPYDDIIAAGKENTDF